VAGQARKWVIPDQIAKLMLILFEIIETNQSLGVQNTYGAEGENNDEFGDYFTRKDDGLVDPARALYQPAVGLSPSGEDNP